MPEVTVHDLDVMTDAEWSFRTGEPSIKRGVFGATRYDPFPAYRHDRAVVEDTATHITDVCPPLWGVDVLLADREEVGRSNGFSDLAEPQRWDEATSKWVRDAPAGLIVMSGKRIPPHPALSRYLTAHEYGHHVEWFLERAGGHRLRSGDALADYTRMRGMGGLHHGSGGRWHDSATEVFACDFRIVVCKVETEYWPHPGVARPDDVDGLPEWWAAALDQLKNPTAERD